MDRIYLDLLSKINSGEYENGYKLPTERELCEAYGVSRITAQRAVLRLVEDGLVTRNKRGGSIVGKNGAFGKPVVIPIVLPYVDDMIHGFLYGAQKQALDFGYTIKAFYSHDDPLKERKILQKFATPPPRVLSFTLVRSSQTFPSSASCIHKISPWCSWIGRLSGLTAR